jgi:KaiC/GvpD/RAD55 family RecA-like ATPase/5S rRNA maturation endonuclease (ribonuclease M5)/Zn ribbon nucleic-acid-binding protein
MTTEKTYIFQRHEACPQCGSNDNLAVSWCEEDEAEAAVCNTPGCGYHLFPDQVLAQGSAFYNGGNSDGKVRRVHSRTENGGVSLPECRKKATKTYRGIKPETFNRFGVYLSNDGRLVFPYHDANHNVIGYKSVAPNNKDWRWGAKDGSGMFGVTAAHSKYRLFLTEGEFDALSLKDLTGDCGVSISSGAGSLVSEYKKMISFIESFEDVYVVMDNDDAGKKAIQDLKPHVDPTKVHFVELPKSIEGEDVKDINDVLQLARKKNFDTVKRRFMDCVYASKNAVPDTIYNPAAIANDVVGDMFGDNDTGQEISTGMRELDDLLGGWRKGEMTTIIAPTSIGKSTFTRAIIAGLISRGHKCMVFSLEEPPRVCVRKIVELLKGDEIYYAETREEANEIARSVTDYLVVHNKNGQIDPEVMAKDIDYAVRGRDVEFVLLDNLTRAIDQSDAYNSINKFLDKLTEVSVGTGVHTFCVSHTRRTNDSTEAPSIQEARGSGLVEALSSNIIALGRKRDENRMHVCLLKNREYGVIGDFYLDYDTSTKRFTNLEYYDEQTQPRAGILGRKPAEEEEKPEGSVPPEIREGDELRQQSGGEDGTDDGGQQCGVPQSANNGESTSGSGESGKTLSRLQDSDEQGSNSSGSEGSSQPVRTEEDDGDGEEGNRNGLPLLHNPRGDNGAADKFNWIVDPTYRPEIKKGRKSKTAEHPNTEKPMSEGENSHHSDA